MSEPLVKRSLAELDAVLDEIAKRNPDEINALIKLIETYLREATQ